MNETTRISQRREQVVNVPSAGRWQSRRVLPAILTAVLAAMFSIGAIAPPATAVEGEESTYELAIGDETITFGEGETVTVGMERITPERSAGGILSRAVYTGNAGTLTVTGSNGTFRYGIAMSIPVTTFVGVFTVTDVSHGGSGGRTPVVAFSGSIPTSNLRGHTYSGSLEGTAFLLGAAVAKTMTNYTTFKN